MKNKMMNAKKLFAFRQWSRKAYATFSSLKLLIKISVLSVAYNLVNPVMECRAQSDSVSVQKHLELNEVQVTGQRTTVVYSQIARTITVVTRKEVEQAPSQSVNEILENVPQVDIRQRGTNGVQADISIQGGSFDQSLILLNGINFTDPQTGHYNLNLPIDIESIERIEILKGPASRVFGTNAFTGAVNFITGNNTKDYLKLNLDGGMYGLYRGSFSAAIKTGKLSNFLSVSRSGSDGYISGTGYTITNAYYSNKFQLKDGDIHFQAGLSDKNYGANGFYSAKYNDQYEYNRTYLGSLGATLGNTAKITPNIYWRRNYDHYVLVHSNPAYYQNFHYTDVFGGTINATIDTKIGKLSIGGEYRKEIIYSTSLGKQLDTADFVKVPGESGKYYTYKDWRENSSIFAEHNLVKGPWFSTIGLMANTNTKLSGIELYPGLDLGYKITENSRVYGSVNRSLRLPTFTDLYYKGYQNLGNPDLKPEQSWTTEVGIKYNKSGVDGHLAFFHRNAKDIIDWMWIDSISKWHTENITQLTTDGIECSLSLSEEFLKSVAPYIKSVSMSYSFTTINKSGNQTDSYYALDNLKHKIGLSITHQVIPQLFISWNASYQDRNGGYKKWNAETQTTETTVTSYKPFVLLDAKMYYVFNKFKAYIDCNNILNTSYIDLGNIQQPGIWVKAGIEMKLGL
jgi:vitamin B12 transporter